MTVDRFGNSPDKRAEPRYPAPTAPARPRNRAREKGRQAIHRARVLEVRIHSPPAQSLRTFGSSVSDLPPGRRKRPIEHSRPGEQGARAGSCSARSARLIPKRATNGVCAAGVRARLSRRRSFTWSLAPSMVLVRIITSMAMGLIKVLAH
jgi:hypothetical protein